MTLTRPRLPEGLVAVVKRDCPTCEMVAPVLAELQHHGDLTVYTQDDPAFPADAGWVVHDSDLSVSWHHQIETVPTLIRVDDGTETKRTVGWSRAEWESISGIDGLGVDLPESRPGCGSLSVDPSRGDELAVRFGTIEVKSRRIDIGALEDEWEAAHDRGWSDGLPVVPPTEARVIRMLSGTSRSPDEVIAVVAPNLVECSVEKVAVNAVMAGCRPEYLPVVLAGVEAICNETFNIHGVLATTMGVGPVLVVNGPIRHSISMNSGMNALGQGNRANLTIGRAVQLVVRNVGGGRPGEIDRSTQGQPGKLGLCFAENEECSHWETLAESRGFIRAQSTVTAFCGEAPRMFFDQLSRTPESLTRHLADALWASVSPRLAVAFDGMLVLSPEHLARFHEAGWDRSRFLDELHHQLVRNGAELIRGSNGIHEGLPAELSQTSVAKFAPGGLLVTRAGGNAGLFSSIIGGWVNGETGSTPVTKEIVP